MSDRKPPEMVWIRWQDSNARYGWHPKAEHDVIPAVCETLGFLLYEDKNCLRLAFSISEFGNVHTSLAIPKNCISKRRKLKRKPG